LIVYMIRIWKCNTCDREYSIEGVVDNRMEAAIILKSDYEFRKRNLDIITKANNHSTTNRAYYSIKDTYLFSTKNRIVMPGTCASCFWVTS